MKNTSLPIKLTCIILFFSALSISIYGKNEANHLVCEYKTNPLGIDILHPRLSWQLNSTENNIMQMAYEIRVSESPTNYSTGKLVWSTGKVNSSQSTNIVYNGKPLKSSQRVYWQVRIWDNNGKTTDWSHPAFWEMGILEPGQWTASWISAASEVETTGSKPCQYFRNEFTTTKKVASARVYITSKGLYQLFLNGKKVGNELFTPGWTSFKKRLQYQTYDITSLLQKKNALGAILGDGWYRGNIGFQKQHNYYGDRLALLLQLKITYDDGTTETLVSNKDWKSGTGSILKSDIYNGEEIDARMDIAGWNQPGFDDSSWTTVAVPDYSKDNLIAPQGVPVKAIQEIKPVKLLVTPKGETVFDMGQNMVGWIRLKLNGKTGEQVTLKFAEVLDKAGNFYTDNLRSAKACDTYILRGNGEEVFEPHFTFHGFRFVKLEGFSGKPDMNQLTGVVIHSDMQPTGTFSCSDSLINQLQHNIQWGQKGNFLDVPTDCPQRDERLGWTGDAQVFSMTAAYNFDVAAFYTKWLKDVAADQLPSGRVPHVIPDVLNGDGGSTAWADVSVVVPWTVYRTYGDVRILEEQYPSMKAWVDYMKTRAGEGNLWKGDNHFGDWLAFASNNSDYTGATTEKDLIATAYFCYSSGLLAKIAGIIGKKEDAEKYAALSKNIKTAFNAEFVTPNGRLVSHTQTAYALALSFDLLPENLKKNAASFFADDVKKFGHLTTGFVGTPLLCKTLSAINRDDLAFMLLMRKKYPSWLYPVTQGATTIWERWDGLKPDGTFQDVGMNSFNHYAYGAIGEWLYNHVAGISIDPENPGYKHVILNPHPGGGLSYANAEFSSMYGLVKSGWKFEGNDFVYEIVVPANTSSTVLLPQADAQHLTMNNLPLKEDLKTKLKESASGIQLELGNGKYVFRYPAGKLKPQQ